MVIVAAAGNDNGGPVDYPAAYPGVIAVGATDSSDARCSFSNTGAALDLVAPGSNILSYGSGSTATFKSWQGTSLSSSPLVAGVVALMRSANSSLTPGEITDILYHTADDLGAGGWDRDFGWGLVDADEAIAQAVNGGTTTTTTVPPSTTTTTEPPSTTTTEPPSTTTTTEPRFADVSAESTPYLGARSVIWPNWVS